MYLNGKKIIQMVKVEGSKPTGEIEITENGTHNVADYESAKVNVETGITPTGEIEITENGTHDVTNYATAKVNIETSGRTDGEYFVKVIDYDGTILKEAWLDNGDTFTLPTPPSHDGLVFQEWSCSQTIVDGVITIEDNNVMVGAVYTTASGLNEFDIEINKNLAGDIENTPYTFTLNMDGTKDWGDGTVDDLTTHDYTSYGKYTIKCNGTTMTSSSSNNIFNNKGICTNIRLANGINLKGYALAYCSALKSVTIPKNIKITSTNVFRNNYSLTSLIIPNGNETVMGDIASYCYSLKSVVIPNTVKQIKSSAFYYCYTLKNVAIPNKTTNLSGFGYCTSLENIIIPNSVKILDSNCVNYCYSLNINIPSGLTTINSSAFTQCYSIKYFNFSGYTTIPTLGNSNAFNSINPTAKIIVPDNLYEEWIVATNWASVAGRIYKASEVQL